MFLCEIECHCTGFFIIIYYFLFINNKYKFCSVMLDSLDSKLFISLKEMVYHAYHMHVFSLSYGGRPHTSFKGWGTGEHLLREYYPRKNTSLSLSLSLSSK